MNLADQDSIQQLIRLLGILSQANQVEKAERSKSAVALKYSKLMNNKSTTSTIPGTKGSSRYFEIQALNSGLALYVLSNDGELIGKLTHEEIASLLKQIEND
jgi:hypothetical protein